MVQQKHLKFEVILNNDIYILYYIKLVVEKIFEILWMIWCNKFYGEQKY